MLADELAENPLQTERLRMRLISRGDQQLIRRLYTDPRMAPGAFVYPANAAMTKFAAELTLARSASAHASLQAYFLVVVAKVDDVPLGVLEFTVPIRPSSSGAGQGTPPPGDIRGVAYRFLPEVAKNGYATEALIGAVDWLFRTSRLPGRRPVYAVRGSTKQNPASARVLARAGFRPDEGAGSDLWRDDMTAAAKAAGCTRHSVTAEQWRARHPNLPFAINAISLDNSPTQQPGSAHSTTPGPRASPAPDPARAVGTPQHPLRSLPVGSDNTALRRADR